MLIIRKEQMDALSEAVSESFEDDRVKHIANKYPDFFDEMGAEDVRQLVRQGIEKSKMYGIQARDNVAFLIDLMVEFGPDFEREGKVSWTRDILRSHSLSDNGKISLIDTRLGDRA